MIILNVRLNNVFGVIQFVGCLGPDIDTRLTFES
jgi:hypothetical protein